jgi:hypothetical protein
MTQEAARHMRLFKGKPGQPKNRMPCLSCPAFPNIARKNVGVRLWVYMAFSKWVPNSACVGAGRCSGNGWPSLPSSVCWSISNNSGCRARACHAAYAATMPGQGRFALPAFSADRGALPMNPICVSCRSCLTRSKIRAGALRPGCIASCAAPVRPALSLAQHHRWPCQRARLRQSDRAAMPAPWRPAIGHRHNRGQQCKCLGRGRSVPPPG